MKRITRPIVLDVLWLTGLFVLTGLVALFLLGQVPFKREIEFYLYDSYFVISSWLILTPLYLLVIFAVFFFRTLKNRLAIISSNWIVLLAGLLLVISLTILIKTFSQFTIAGWTLYPPLSGLGSDRLPEIGEDQLVKVITNLLTVLQVTVLVTIAFFMFRWGRNSKTT